MPPSHKPKPTTAGHRRAGTRAAPAEKKAAARTAAHAKARPAAKAHGAAKHAPAAKPAASARTAVPARTAAAGKLPSGNQGARGQRSRRTAAQERTQVWRHAQERGAVGGARASRRRAEDRQSQLKLLIARGKEQGYLTYAQVNDHLPSEIVDPEQIEDIVNTINDMGIPVYEKATGLPVAPGFRPRPRPDEEAIEEAAAAAGRARRGAGPHHRIRCACTCARWPVNADARGRDPASQAHRGRPRRRYAWRSPATRHARIPAAYLRAVKAGQARMVDLVVASSTRTRRT